MQVTSQAKKFIAKNKSNDVLDEVLKAVEAFGEATFVIDVARDASDERPYIAVLASSKAYPYVKFLDLLINRLASAHSLGMTHGFYVLPQVVDASDTKKKK